MRVVIQRVLNASVKVDEEKTGEIGKGILVFVGIETQDNDEDVYWLSRKIVQLRIFADTNGLMNKSVIDVQGDILLVSQFTLHASTKNGNRPAYSRACKSEVAITWYNKLLQEIGNLLGKPVKEGVFGADMQVELVNDGPVTIWIDSRNKE